MADSLDEEEVRERNVRAMGSELGELYTVLTNELVWQFIRWTQFEKLFGLNAARVDLLNESAPLFFRIVQDLLWHDTMLGIARLAGPSETRVARAVKQNLSIQRLPALLQDMELRKELEVLTAIAKDKARFAFDWRNRMLAHRDLDVAMKRHVKPLASSTRLSVNSSLDSIADVLNRVDLHYFESTMGFRNSANFTDADSLLHVIRDGLKFDARRRAKLEQGLNDPSDWDDQAI